MKMNNKTCLLAIALGSVFATNASMAATATSTMTVDATLTTACEVSSTSAINFGSFAALASSGDKTADTGSSFQVACSKDAAPNIYATGTRSMINGANTLPFNLSLTAGAAANDLPLVTGTALVITQDGSLKDVKIYGKTLASNYKALGSGAYTASIAVVVAY